MRLLPLYAFMAWTGANLPLPVEPYYIDEIGNYHNLLLLSKVAYSLIFHSS